MITGIEDKSENEVTFKFYGNPTIDEYAYFVSNSRHLVKSVTASSVKNNRRQPNKLHWYPSNASVNGSVLITYSALTQNQDSFERFQDAFFRVGDALRTGEEIGFTHRVEKYAQNLRKVIKDEDDTLVFENQTHETVIKPDYRPASNPSAVSAYDEVKGTIETISSRHGLRFILYDAIFDRAVTCYVDSEEDERMLAENFRELVTVNGLVSRDPETDRPLKITKIRNICKVAQRKYSWRDVEGIIKLSSEMTPERYVREVRDG